MILLWMTGGPPTIDIWDLKPGMKPGGPFKPIPTTGAGHICEYLPLMAKQMKHVNLIRTYNSKEGDHKRGIYTNRAAFTPVASVVHPSIGAVVARTTPPAIWKSRGISVWVARMSVQAFWDRLTPRFAFRPVTSRFPTCVVGSPMSRSPAVPNFCASRKRGSPTSTAALCPATTPSFYEKTFQLMTSKLLGAFPIDQEDSKTREHYGDTEFGRDCLLARRLVEQVGVPFIAIGWGGWDLHQNTHAALAGVGRTPMGTAQPILPTLDKALLSLIEDLYDRGHWETTTLCWMGDFGRTPRINQDAGRDHWPSPWTILVGGGGMKGGEVIGETTEDGMAVKDRPVDISNLFATLYKSVGIEPATELRTLNGRPLKLVSAFGDGKAVAELF